jgi:hypothetical protein
MNEAELILAVNEITSTMLDEESVFYTQVTAYLVVAYLVAEKLTKFQLALINFLFVVAAALSIFGVLNFMHQIERLFATTGGTAPFIDPALYLTITFRLMILVGALVFMWQARQSKAE